MGVGGKAALGFGVVWIRTVVVMATKTPIAFYWGKWCLHLFLVIFDRILAKLASIQDGHKISDEFKFQPDWIIHFRVTRP